MTDSQIVELYWKRDESAITYTKERYGERLKHLAFRILDNNEDAEESESDTYLKAWNTMPPQRPNYLYGFLAKICRYVALDKLDWNNAQKRNAEIVQLTSEIEECIPDNAAAWDFEKEEIGKLLNSFLKTISKENRLIFERRYFLDDPICDIARRYSISESKVKSSLFRTRNKLRNYLNREGLIDL